MQRRNAEGRLQNRSRRAGFSLMELLAVLAIAGMLAAVMVPVAGRVRTSARRAKVRVQFAQWTAAFEGFRAEYGFYPQLIQNRVNGASSAATGPSIADPDTRFQEILSGRGTGAGAPPAFRSSEQNLASGAPAAQNRRRIALYAFAPDELDAAGRVIDAFGNPDIAVVVDTDGDGVIPAADLAAVAVGSRDQPAVTTAPAAADLPAGGVRAGVVFFSAGAGWDGPAPRPDNLVLSWK